MKIRVSLLAFIFVLTLNPPIAMAATKPVLAAQIKTYPMVNDKCSKAGQWAGFADSRYSLKTWKRIDKSDEFREYPSPHFGIYVCKLVGSKLLWQRYSPYDSNFATGRVYSPTSPYITKILKDRSAPYPGTGKKCEVQSCLLGSIGPAGGIIFYDAGKVEPWGRYLEVAPQGWTGLAGDLSDRSAQWCGNLQPSAFSSISDLGKTVTFEELSKTIGTGKALTARMLKSCATGAATVATSYFGGGSTDWFLPSNGEINELCKFVYGHLNSPTYIFCDVLGNPRLGLDGIYWTSQQIIPKFPIIGVQEYVPFKNGQISQAFRQQSAGIDVNWAIRPIRSFSSPSDPLQKTGLIQMAGVGASTWPEKCPAVIDKVGGAQPQVTGFFFDGAEQNFVRLEDNSATSVKAAKNLVGCYADLENLSSDIGNGYHIGSINRDSTGYYWQNAQGVRFGLTLSGKVMITDQDNPYYSTGRQFILKP